MTRRRRNSKSSKKKKYGKDEGKPNKPYNWRKHRDAQVKRNKEPEIPEGDLQKAIKETQKSLSFWKKQAEDLANKPYVPPENPFDELDEWQREAVDLMLQGQHIVVDAPTTAGKTRVVEAFFAHNLDRPDFRACYTCPVKSLSNDKLKEFRETFGKENVGISTGDIKENLDAPIVVATLESYRNSLLGIEPDLNRQLVVFDEYHYIQDQGRGTAWEEAMILTPPGCQMLLLSASIGNPEDIAEWIENLQKRPAKLVTVQHRPVPLADLVYTNGAWVKPGSIENYLPKGKRPDKLDSIQMPKLAQYLREASVMGLTPCIVYAGKRASCLQLAHAIAKEAPRLTDKERNPISEVLQKLHKENGVLSLMPNDLRQIVQGYGVAYHHSGLQPTVRFAIECLLKDGLLKFCTATMGLSLGINFSVRAAVVSDFMRPGEFGPTIYSASEVQQMLGRAGRRGKDAVGYSLWPNLASFQKFAGRSRQPVRSQLKNEPTTFLGLVGRGFSLRAIESFYKKSFYSFQNPKFEFSVVKHKSIQEHVKQKDLPCVNAVDAFGRFINKESSPCRSCPVKKPCHQQMRQMRQTSLGGIQIHLHKIGALTEDNKLTGYGNLARFFPHSGGLILAELIFNEEITSENLAEAFELIAAFSLAFFKSPDVPEQYELPFDLEYLEERIDHFYPLEYFPDLYDPPFGRRSHYVIREFNALAGWIAREWVRGIEWNDLVEQVTNQYFSAGDVSNLLYRSISYLQTVAQLKFGEVSTNAARLRADLLREPLDFGIN